MLKSGSRFLLAKQIHFARTMCVGVNAELLLLGSFFQKCLT